MLDTNIKSQLKVYFEKIVSPIVLTASADASEKSAEMLELLNEVAEQSDKITYRYLPSRPTAKLITSLVSPLVNQMMQHALHLLGYQWVMK